jgi:hypothetical protein
VDPLNGLLVHSIIRIWDETSSKKSSVDITRNGHWNVENPPGSPGEIPNAVKRHEK